MTFRSKRVGLLSVEGVLFTKGEIELVSTRLCMGWWSERTIKEKD